jgi:hypothetical protein
MNKYNLSALSKKGRADIFNEAEKDGVIIQDCNTNGDVRREFVLITPDVLPLVNSVWDIDIMNGTDDLIKCDL